MDAEPPESTGSLGLDEMNRRLTDAPTREAKRAVLLDYCSEDQAEHTLGLVMGDHDGDVIERAQPTGS